RAHAWSRATALVVRDSWAGTSPWRRANTNTDQSGRGAVRHERSPPQPHLGAHTRAKGDPKNHAEGDGYPHRYRHGDQISHSHGDAINYSTSLERAIERAIERATSPPSDGSEQVPLAGRQRLAGMRAKRRWRAGYLSRSLRIKRVAGRLHVALSGKMRLVALSRSERTRPRAAEIASKALRQSADWAP